MRQNVHKSPTRFDIRSRDATAELLFTVFVPASLVPESRSSVEQWDQQLGSIVNQLVDQYAPEERREVQ